MNTKQFLSEGPKIEIRTDRYTYGVPAAVRGHEGINQGSFETNASMTTFIFGPCIAESISITKARKAADFFGKSWRQLLGDMVKPKATRYMLLDGQRLILVISEEKPPLLFADSHASFDDDQWLIQFPRELWDQ